MAVGKNLKKDLRIICSENDKTRITQTKQSDWGPSSLKMVLSHYGIDKSEKYLANMTKTSKKLVAMK